jgi:hypothetical protein
VVRVWFSGKHPLIIPVAFCRRFYAGLSDADGGRRDALGGDETLYG